MDERIRTTLAEILSQCEIIRMLMKRFGDDMEDFITDDAYNMSCTFALMQIGEHVKRIDTWLNENCDNVDWNSICRFRDLVAHNYGKVSKKIVWNIMTEDIPVMMETVSALMRDR